MKKTIFAMMAFVVAAVIVGCKKNEQKCEVTMTVIETTDSTAVVRCEYNPVKSVSYKLRIGASASKEYNYSREFTISGLKAGTRYNIVSIAYDADHRRVDSTVMDFMTTGEPDNSDFDPHQFQNDSIKQKTPEDSIGYEINRSRPDKAQQKDGLPTVIFP